MSDEAFLNLPITFDDEECKPDGWRRRIVRQGTVRELLDTWDIDDEYDTDVMAQVLRHLREQMRTTSQA